MDEAAISEFPKWVKVHDSHIVRKESDVGVAIDPATGAARQYTALPHVSTPAWQDFHVNREDGSVTVLVKDAEEEAKALADAQPVEHAEPPEETEPPPHDPASGGDLKAF
jgi:hypothetical protein